MNYYHGGFPGLRIGELVLPPAITGAASTASFGADRVCRRDRVYVTTEMSAAVLFAAGHPSTRGVVYEVEPIGQLEHDPDCMLYGMSFQCEKARVLRVIQLSNRTRKRAMRALVS
jgi:hypothetical protein